MTDSTQKDRDETYNVFLFLFTVAILVAYLSGFIAGEKNPNLKTFDKGYMVECSGDIR